MCFGKSIFNFILWIISNVYFLFSLTSRMSFVSFFAHQGSRHTTTQYLKITIKKYFINFHNIYFLLSKMKWLKFRHFCFSYVYEYLQFVQKLTIDIYDNETKRNENVFLLCYIFIYVLCVVIALLVWWFMFDLVNVIFLLEKHIYNKTNQNILVLHI